MLIDFFCKCRDYKIPCTLRELLALIEAIDKKVVFANMDDFYIVSRVILVKDESHFDKFDRAFADYFNGISSVELDLSALPDAWLKTNFEKQLTQAEKAQIEALGGLEQLMKTLAERLKEQKERHEGGSKWIGTGGTSPFGANGYNPEGVRIGNEGTRQRKAVKVWDKRQYKNLDDQVEIGTRNIKVALRKLRKFARSGESEILALDETITATARNAGFLDLKMKPERHNAIKLLMFFDIGGSMDDHIKVCEQLFSAVHSEFKHLVFFYYHNCLYENVWRDASRSSEHDNKLAVNDLIHTYGQDYKVIFVSDATMSPHEVNYPGGSVEEWNQEAGGVWMQRVVSHFDQCIWLNPQPEQVWEHHFSIELMKDIIKDRMFPLTVDGLMQGIKALN